MEQRNNYFRKSLKFWALAIFTFLFMFFYYQFAGGVQSAWINYAIAVPIAGALLCAFMEQFSLFATVLAFEGYMILNGIFEATGSDSWVALIVLGFAVLLAIVCIGITIATRKPSYGNHKWL